MDCIDLFKKAAAALQTDPRYLELDAARRENASSGIFSVCGLTVSRISAFRPLEDASPSVR